MTARPSNQYEKYHAHVYFDASSIDRAKSICNEAGERFGVKVGRFHEKPIGPHPHWSCQLSFDESQFEALIPWLDKARQGLSVLVHALTDNDIEDHTNHASWLGDEVELNLSVFDKTGEDE